MSTIFISLAKTLLLKNLIFFVFVFCNISYAQDYIDLFKISYIQNFDHAFQNAGESTNIQSLEADLTFPIQIDANNAIITGFLYNQNSLSFFPENNGFPTNISERTTVYSTTLKLGINRTLSEKWSGAFVFLPKLSSDYIDISSDDFFLGGFSLFKYQKNQHLAYKLGGVVIQQTFGVVAIPLFGLYYKSPNDKLEVDLTLPVAGDASYGISKSTAFGVNYYGIGRSYDIHQENIADYYIDYASLEFSGYLQYGLLDNSVLLRAKLGYATFTGEAYAEGDDIDVRIAGLFDVGDNRNQLNPKINSGFFGKFEAVYRFDLSKNE